MTGWPIPDDADLDESILITPAQIRARQPCGRWAKDDQIEAVFRRHSIEAATPLQIATCEDVSAEDRLWILLHPSILGDCELRLLNCWHATRMLHAKRRTGREPDARSWEAVRIARQYAVGRATPEKLAAAMTAAMAALTAGAAARAAAGTAARTAVWAPRDEATLRYLTRRLERGEGLKR